MSSRGHYIKPVSRGGCPSCLVSVAVKSQDAGRVLSADSDSLRVFQRAFVSTSTRDRGRWSRPLRLEFGRPELFWDWLESWATTYRSTYVFSPIASDALTLLGFWGRLDRQGCRWERDDQPRQPHYANAGGEPRYVVRRLVLRSRPDIVDYRTYGRRFVWLSAQQYFRCSWHDLRRSVAGGVHEAPSHGRAGPDEAYSDILLSSLILAAVQQAGDWWRGLRAGPWRETVSGLAWGFWRSRLRVNEVCTHANPEALELERRARYGARVSCWYYGDVRPGGEAGPPIPGMSNPAGGPAIPGPAYHFDVSSMYPWLMRENVFPVKFKEVLDDVSVAGLAELLGPFLAIAHVRLRTWRAEYPHRRDERVWYPVGTFTATLCGPELARALADGEVTKVYRVALYWPGRPFAVAASELIRMREDAKRTGNTMWDVLTKLLANSLTGRLALRQSRWKPCPGRTPEKRWGEWIGRNHDTGSVTRWRGIAGLCHALDRTETCTGTLGAQYAFITSYGRHHMRRVRESLPPLSVLAQHTDGIWVTREAYDALAGASASASSPPPPCTSVAGVLRLTDMSTKLRLWTASHYLSDLGWTLGGFHRPAVTGYANIVDTYTQNLIRTCPHSPPNAYVERVRRTVLDCRPDPGGVDEFGWHTPPILPSRDGAYQPDE